MSTNINRHDLPYRACAGIALFNREGKIFMGRRKHAPNTDEGDAAAPWQMPQGGIDAGEQPAAAALRELAEETSVTNAKIIAEATKWINYDLPDAVLGKALKGKFRGQKQRWFAVLFTGENSEINVINPMNGQHASEFSDFAWMDLHEIADLVVAFKRDVYMQVAEQFETLPNRILKGEFEA